VLALKIVPEHLSRPDTRNVLDFALRQTRKKSTSLKPRPVANVRQGTRKPDGTVLSSQNAGRAKITFASVEFPAPAPPSIATTIIAFASSRGKNRRTRGLAPTPSRCLTDEIVISAIGLLREQSHYYIIGELPSRKLVNILPPGRFGGSVASLMVSCSTYAARQNFKISWDATSAL
jgi:hypothetical protein